MNFFKKTWQQTFDAGMKYGSEGNFPKAVESFRKAVSLAPNEPYPHYELGYTLFLMENYQEALPELQKTNELQHGFFLVQTEIYMCEAIISGMINYEVLATLREIQRLSDNGQIHSETALKLSRKVIEESPQCALGYYHYGKGMIGVNDEQAVNFLEKCLTLNPDETTEIDAKQHIALFQEAVGNVESARLILQELLANYSDNPHNKISEVILQQVNAN